MLPDRAHAAKSESPPPVEASRPCREFEIDHRPSDGVSCFQGISVGIVAKEEPPESSHLELNLYVRDPRLFGIGIKTW